MFPSLSIAVVGIERLRKLWPSNGSFTPLISATGTGGENVWPRSVDFTCIIPSIWLSYQVT
jgi:hypothetical protein